MALTMQLKTIIEQPTQNNPELTLKQKIEIGRNYLFGDMDYPMFDEEYRKEFETHFIRQFYMRQIGFETASLFKMELETWLIINMPYYNRMFESENLKFDPLVNTALTVKNDKEIDNTRDFESENNATTNRNVDDVTDTTNRTKVSSTDKNFNRELDAEVPMDRLQLQTGDGTGTLEYASNITENTTNGSGFSDTDATGKAVGSTDMEQVDKSETTNNTTSKTLEDSTYTKVGKIGVGSYSKMVSEYRNTFMRIENKMFKEMSKLFLQIYL